MADRKQRFTLKEILILGAVILMGAIMVLIPNEEPKSPPPAPEPTMGKASHDLVGSRASIDERHAGFGTL
jgi:hypothetical protein